MEWGCSSYPNHDSSSSHYDNVRSVFTMPMTLSSHGGREREAYEDLLIVYIREDCGLSIQDEVSRESYAKMLYKWHGQD